MGPQLKKKKQQKKAKHIFPISLQIALSFKIVKN